MGGTEQPVDPAGVAGGGRVDAVEPCRLLGDTQDVAVAVQAESNQGESGMSPSAVYVNGDSAIP